MVHTRRQPPNNYCPQATQVELQQELYATNTLYSSAVEQLVAQLCCIILLGKVVGKLQTACTLPKATGRRMQPAYLHTTAARE